MSVRLVGDRACLHPGPATEETRCWAVPQRFPTPAVPPGRPHCESVPAHTHSIFRGTCVPYGRWNCVLVSPQQIPSSEAAALPPTPLRASTWGLVNTHTMAWAESPGRPEHTPHSHVLPGDSRSFMSVEPCPWSQRLLSSCPGPSRQPRARALLPGLGFGCEECHSCFCSGRDLGEKEKKVHEGKMGPNAFRPHKQRKGSSPLTLQPPELASALFSSLKRQLSLFLDFNLLTWVCCPTYSRSQQLILACALARDEPPHVGLLGRCSNQVSCIARAGASLKRVARPQVLPSRCSVRCILVSTLTRFSWAEAETSVLRQTLGVGRCR